MAFDTSRLYSTLLTSRIQSDNPALYQVIYQLIGALSSLAVTVNSSGGGSSSGGDSIIEQNIYQIIQGSRESSGGSSRVIPGPAGRDGTPGTIGATGPAGAIGIVRKFVESYPKYIPIQGNQGNPGTTGAQGPVSPIITSRLTEIVRRPIQIFQTIGNTGGAGSYVYLATRTASASATLDFTSLISSTYNKYVFDFENILPAIDNTELLMRTSTDNGATYDAGASDYGYADYVNNTGAFSTNTVSAAASSSIKVMPSLDFGSTTGGVNGSLSLYNPLNATQYKAVSYHVSAFLDDGQFYNCVGSGRRISTADIDAVRFLMNSGNIASGTIRMYGVKNS